MTSPRRGAGGLAILVTATVCILLSPCEAQAQGYYGHRNGRFGYGPPGSGAWYGMAGCGLGSMIFGPVDTPLAQILAATTNSTTGSQTFGITSGTSNCVTAGAVRAEREQAAFAEVNFRDLKRDLAAGGGEFLNSFATLLGCEPGTTPALARKMQTRYQVVVPSEETTPMELVVNIKTEIDSDTGLAGRCSDERAIARAEGLRRPERIVAPASPSGQNLAMTSRAAAVENSEDGSGDSHPAGASAGAPAGRIGSTAGNGPGRRGRVVLRK